MLGKQPQRANLLLGLRVMGGRGWGQGQEGRNRSEVRRGVAWEACLRVLRKRAGGRGLEVDLITIAPEKMAMDRFLGRLPPGEVSSDVISGAMSAASAAARCGLTWQALRWCN